MPSCSQEETQDSDLLRREPPYWFTFTTNAKMRWYGRRVLDVLVEEFRDRTKHYYNWAIHNGLLQINGSPVLPSYIIQNGDVITHRAHKHEPPITRDPVRILHHDEGAARVVVVKPGSVPVHAAGRYLRHTLLELLKSDHGLDRVLTANRLDRLTSGIMITSTTPAAAKKLGMEFEAGKVRKAYVCRVQGRFPEKDTSCEAPLLTLDRQTGVVVSHAIGREAKTLFNRIAYDESSDTSVLYCRPITGRTHQIRVHAQLLGFPIPNDPLYNHSIWTQHPPASIAQIIIPSSSSQGDISQHQTPANANSESTKLLAATHPCAAIIEALKSSKDQGEDFSRLKDEVRFAEWNQQNGWLESHTVTGINADPAQGTLSGTIDGDDSLGYCEECHVPLLPDPKPEDLFIYLHAIRYETNEWSYEDEMPWWALEDWQIPGAQLRAVHRRTEGQGIRPPRLRLFSEAEAAEQLRTNDTSSFNADMALTALPKVATGHASSSVTCLARNRKDSFVLELKPFSSPNYTEGRILETTETPPLVLEIFRGLEDFARRDFVTRLDISDEATAELRTALHSSYLLTPRSLSDSALQMPLPFVSGKYFLVGMTRLPDELTAKLSEERKLLGTFKWRNKSARQKKKHRRVAEQSANDGGQATEENEEGHEDRAEEPSPAQGIQRLEDGITLSEARMKSIIERLWKDNVGEFHKVLDAWAKHLKSRGRLPSGKDTRWSWRASVDRSAYHFPTLVTTQLEGVLADCIWRTFNGEARIDKGEYIAHPVSLKEPDLDVRLVFVPWLAAEEATPSNESDTATSRPKNFAQAWESNPPGSIMLTVKLEHTDDFENLTDSIVSDSTRISGSRELLREASQSSLALAHRPFVSNDLTEGGTALARFRAYSLASLLPIVREDAGKTVSASLRFWEPCVGTGSIAIELAQMLAERKNMISAPEQTITVYGSDVGEEEVKRAREISRLSGWPESVTRDGVRLRIEHLDLANLATSATQEGDEATGLMGLRDWFEPGTLDGVVTDLPWGRRVLGHGALGGLYLRFVQACVRSLRPGRYAVALTLEHKTMHRALREADGFARKRGEKWTMAIEELSLNDGETSVVERQGQRQAMELEGIRVVGMGLRPYIFLLKKVPLTM